MEEPQLDAASRHKRRGWMWTHNQTSRLIELWSQEECLYNSSIDEYRDQVKRENALERVRMRMEEDEPPAPSVADIHNKMKGLKIYYSSIRTKLKRGLLNGGGSESGDELPAIRWPHYNAMSFINDSISHRKSNNSANFLVDISHSMVEHPSSLHGNSLQKRRRNETVYEKMEGDGEPNFAHAQCMTCDMIRDNNAAVAISSENNKNGESDPDVIFGKLITSQLKKIGEGRTKEKLKMDLQKTIFDILYPEPSPYH